MNDQETQNTETAPNVNSVGFSDLLAERNKKAAEIVRAEVKQREEETMSPLYKSWRYTDFVDEDRFLDEIKTDKGVNDSMDAEELAEYAIEQIYS